MYFLSRLKNYFLLFAVASVVIMFSSSCANMKKITYLQGSFDTAKLSKINPIEPVIRKGDLLSIIVFSDNPEATKIYNQSIITAGGATPGVQDNAASGIKGNTPTSAGYDVDLNGNIVFQGLGILHVEGLTKAQLKDTLDSRLKEYLKNPYYNIRFLNYKFTMLGEIARPGVINIPGDRINLLEALSLAGDMTFYGRRDSIMVIRESNGIREFGRLDITKPEVILSPYFYLQQNDVVIVEASKKKAVANDQVTARTISIALAFISTFAVVYSLFKK